MFSDRWVYLRDILVNDFYFAASGILAPRVEVQCSQEKDKKDT
jgi:hypothetical protein